MSENSRIITATQKNALEPFPNHHTILKSFFPFGPFILVCVCVRACVHVSKEMQKCIIRIANFIHSDKELQEQCMFFSYVFIFVGFILFVLILVKEQGEVKQKGNTLTRGS